MVTYYLAQADDGRVTLDRECHGSLLKAITVSDPEVIRREVEGEMVDVPQYWQSYANARVQVDEGEFRHVRGEGYFA
ncbi:hypothetical protein [Paraburkholderia phenoliruptrix]|uniref:hypothetical protein n=1 Tax=Paraburkholderia phenoliruptrix TaxID=252970 RepID=UPI0028577164|nr:hypothetical protein [Paraburkholderia phenoliruptrix]MDR6389211.1 hypothetical protein [Paraburkholderia phenoliruptrix]